VGQAEHLIENAIIALKNKREDDFFGWDVNKMMAENVGINLMDVYGMAVHVVYSLYDGKFPDFPE
jgi:hypothetical protein